MENHGFKPPNTRRKNDSGAPEYPARLLLKILVYGYMNKLRSSYNMERACRINVEMMWLTGMLHPSHTTICTFRRKHPKALKNVFRTYNHFLDNALQAFGKETVAIDGSKFRAQNSKTCFERSREKNNYNQKKIDRHLAYIAKREAEMLEYLKALEAADQSGETADLTKAEPLNKDLISKALDELKQNPPSENAKKSLADAGESPHLPDGGDKSGDEEQNYIAETSENEVIIEPTSDAPIQKTTDADKSARLPDGGDKSGGGQQNDITKTPENEVIIEPTSDAHVQKTNDADKSAPLPDGGDQSGENERDEPLQTDENEVIASQTRDAFGQNSNESDKSINLPEGLNATNDKDLIISRLHELSGRRKKYETLQAQLDEASKTGDRQISTVDADARALPLRMNIVEVGYNVQTAVDEKYNLIVEYEATNQRDERALYRMGAAARRAFGLPDDEVLNALADKGYHTGEELKLCAEGNIVTYVAPKAANHGKKPAAFWKDKFRYDGAGDFYVCPAGKILKSKGAYLKKPNRDGGVAYRFKRYKLPYKVCSACPFAEACVGAGKLKVRHGRDVERSEYEDYVVANKVRVEANKAFCRRRQAIVEHPFGTIKRGWGYTHTLLKDKEKVNGEFGLVFLSYNIRRSVSIFGVLELIKALKGLFLRFFARFGAHGLHRTYHSSFFALFFDVLKGVVSYGLGKFEKNGYV